MRLSPSLLSDPDVFVVSSIICGYLRRSQAKRPGTPMMYTDARSAQIGVVTGSADQLNHFKPEHPRPHVYTERQRADGSISAFLWESNESAVARRCHQSLLRACFGMSQVKLLGQKQSVLNLRGA